MGNAQSTVDREAPTGRHGGLPRLQAITEGARRGRGGLAKLPPGTSKSLPEDWPFIEVWFDSVCKGFFAREGASLLLTADTVPLLRQRRASWRFC